MCEEEYEVPKTLFSKHSLHLLETLFYCPTCLEVKCPLCIDQDIVSRFCVQCFSEVTESSARASTNTCLRNCLLCPECGCNAKVTNSPSEQDKYLISCHYCSWKFSSELTKTASLSHQVRAMARENTSDFTDAQKFVQRYLQKQNPRNKDPIIKFDLKLTDGSTQDDDVPPPPLSLPKLCPLRSKTEKRCRECGSCVSKPDPRPESRDFKIKSIAMMHLPSLNLEPYVPTESNKTLSGMGEKDYYLLTISNPFALPIQVSLGSPKTAGITISVPDFELGPASRKWDEKSLAEGVSHSKIVRASRLTKRVFMERSPHPPHGFHDAGKNWAIVQFEVRDQSVDNPYIPLFVSFTQLGQTQDFWCVFKPEL